MSDIITLVGELTAVRGQRDALMVEIERLRTEVDKCTVVRESLYEALATANKSVAERNAEIEGLRELLLEAREFLPDEVISIEHRRDTDYADHLADRIDAALSPERMLEERDAEIELLTEIERLRGAIRTHKDNVWGVTTIEHEEDKKLYEAIGE